MKNRLPDFLILGAMKSGTTTLYNHLEQNQGVYMSSPKELNFFSDLSVYDRGVDWYQARFAEARPDQVCGEASPSYTQHPQYTHAADRIAALIPDVKLIYIMRHPVDRFYSNYVFDRAYGHNVSIRETLESGSYMLDVSNYMLQIKKYLEHFSQEQMHFLLLDDLQEKPINTLAQLLDFLEVENAETNLSKHPVHLQANPRGRNFMMRQCNVTLQRLREMPAFRLAKHAVPAEMRSKITDYMTQGLPDSSLGKWLSQRHVAKTEPLTPELRRELLDRLAEPTTQLEHFLGRDLTAWRS